MIKVAIIEDHHVLVDAFAHILESEEDLQFVGAEGTIEAGQYLIGSTHPDVLLLDISLPDGDGIDALPEITSKSPETQVIVLTSFSDERNLVRALESGAVGFVAKSSSLASLLNTIRQAADGEIVVPSCLLSGLLLRLTKEKAAAYQQANGWEKLTLREEEILNFLAEAKSGEAIAAELHISPLTVRTHIRNIMEKLGVHSRLEAVSFGLRNGLISPPV
ncbi:MAG TPA: response regulator transcription factor [Anaerolineales bacterium]|nr:response regulator transcription factor [Anaerolineales bacterium]